MKKERVPQDVRLIPKKPERPDLVFGFENEDEIERYREKMEQIHPANPNRAILPVPRNPKPALPAALPEVITLARCQAAYGAVCNPWLDDGVDGILYAPLLDSISENQELTSGDKKFHAALVYRARMCRDWLRKDKLVASTGHSLWAVNNYLRKFKDLGLIRSRFKGLFLLAGPTKDTYLERGLMTDFDYNAIHKSRIPWRLMNTSLISDGAVVLYGRLCGLAGKKGWWFGTYDGLAEACGCHHDTIRRAVQELERKAMIKVDRENRYHSGFRRGPGASRYYFLGHRLFRPQPE